MSRETSLLRCNDNELEVESKVDQVETDHGAEKQVELEIDYWKMKQEEVETNQLSTSTIAQPRVEQQGEQDKPDDKDASEDIKEESHTILLLIEKGDKFGNNKDI